MIGKISLIVIVMFLFKVFTIPIFVHYDTTSVTFFTNLLLLFNTGLIIYTFEIIKKMRAEIKALKQEKGIQEDKSEDI